MSKNKSKFFALCLAFMLLFMTLSTSGLAATIQTTLKAQFVSFRIVLNDQEVTPKDSLGNTVQPLLVNNTAYLPLRAFGDLFGKNVDFNNDLKKVSITDRAGNEAAGLKAQVVEKDNQITILNSQLAAANKKIADLEKKSSSSKDIEDVIADMAENLNDTYDDKNFGEDYLYNEFIEFDAITLKGDEDDLTLKVKIDLTDFYDENSNWSDDIDEDDIVDLMQEICDEIWDDNDLEDADIDGTIYDISERKNLNTFTVRAGRTVQLD